MAGSNNSRARRPTASPVQLVQPKPSPEAARLAGPELEPLADSDPYPLYPAGEYTAVCTGSKYYLDPRFQVYKMRLDFKIVDFDNFVQPVCKFFNLDKDGRAKRGSDYRRAWIMVKGAAPHRNDRMTAKIFHGRHFRIRIGDTTKKWVSKGRQRQEHLEAEIYSTVKELLELL